VPVQIGTRNELMVAMDGAIRAREPTRLLVIVRLGGYQDFTMRFGDSAIYATATSIAGHLQRGDELSTFYYRPREDELCLLVEGQFEPVEQALSEAAHEVNDLLGPNGIAVGYATATLPYGTHTLIESLRFVDRRIVDADGNAMPRSYRTDFMSLRGTVQTEPNRDDWSLRIDEQDRPA
jgi:hypothetical protein